MSAISLSAPHFSEKEKEREFAELNEKEKKDILDDKYGRLMSRNNAANNDNDITEELLDKYFDEIIAVPFEEKEDYTFVCDYFPHLLRDESHPKWFLRATKYHPKAAAKLQIEYWKLRLKVFGEHAFDRIMSIGDGAMKHLLSDMLHLPNIFRILPDDEHGRTVLCFDKGNIRYQDCDDLTLIKIIWFVVHIALQRQSTQVNGVVLIIINQSSGDFASRNFLRLAVKSFYEALPIRIVCTHVCISSLMATYILPFGMYLMSREMRLRLQAHNTLKKPTLLEEMENFGIYRKNLPKSIGGNFDEKPIWLDECERKYQEEWHNNNTDSRRRKRQRENN